MCVFILPVFHVSLLSNFLVRLFEFFESGSCDVSRLSSNSEFPCLYLSSTKVTEQGLPFLLDPTFLSSFELLPRVLWGTTAIPSFMLYYAVFLAPHVIRLSMETSPISCSESHPSFPCLQYLFLLHLICTARKLDYRLLRSCYK